MRIRLELPIGGHILSVGDVADELESIAKSLRYRYGGGSPVQFGNKPRVADGATFEVADGKAGQPDPVNLSLISSLRELALSLEHCHSPLQRSAGEELRRRVNAHYPEGK